MNPWNTAACPWPPEYVEHVPAAALASRETAEKLSGATRMILDLSRGAGDAPPPEEAARIIAGLREAAPGGRLDIVAGIIAGRDEIAALPQTSKWCAAAGICEFRIAQAPRAERPSGTHLAALGAWAARMISKGRCITLEALSPGDIFARPGAARLYTFVTSGTYTAIVPDPAIPNIISNTLLQSEACAHHNTLTAAARLHPQNLLSMMLLLEGRRNAARIRHFTSPDAGGESDEFELALQSLGFTTASRPFSETGTVSSHIGTHESLSSLPLTFTYVARPPLDAEHIAELDTSGKHEELGAVYGYPQCCIEENLKARAEGCRSNIDFMRRAVRNAPAAGPLPFVMNPAMNIYLPHFPCSTGCAPSLSAAENTRAFFSRHYPAVNVFGELKLAGHFIFTGSHVVQSRERFQPREYAPEELVVLTGAKWPSTPASIEVKDGKAVVRAQGREDDEGPAAEFV